MKRFRNKQRGQKMKTHKGMVDRVKLSSGGKVFRMAQRQNHLLQKKSTTNRLKKRNYHAFAKSDMGKVKVLLPYSGARTRGEIEHKARKKAKALAEVK
jgi:ribosomal protein L35